ncbi:hypothetical protein BpHYR1_045898 [Brachionus plicatilis]|uniref:Uncharacterized protein n=1 Tax=Brachionus plicatilis TaxID=10195 RepID=A0A3M7S720_BRAPC|nr:hypothetical protein BpHYR1_045898 [Brachionus plicatilis]
MEKERLISILNFAIGFLYVILTITIFGLDIAVMSKTNYAGSIAMKSFDSFISYNGIYTAVIVMSIFNIVAVIFSVFILIVNKNYFYSLLSSTATLFFLGIPKEAITYKYMVCFNYTFYQVVQARACLTLILVILIGLFHLLIFIPDQTLSKNWYKLVKIVLLLVSILVLIGIAILNIFLLVKLNTSFKKDINPGTIKMGFFNQTEIDLIEQEKFVKDPNYSYRFVGTLYDILFSNNKRLAYSYCSRSNCRRYYLRFLKAEIICDAAAQSVYPDCSNNLKLIIQLKYLDSGAYPSYNCAVMSKNSTCFSSCPGLGDRKLFLVQEFDDKVELGWSGFSNCEVKTPRLLLTKEASWNICPINFSQKIKVPFLNYVFFCFLLLTMFL